MHWIEIFAFDKYSDLETRVRNVHGHWKGAPFNKSCMTFCYCSIVTMDLSCTFLTLI